MLVGENDLMAYGADDIAVAVGFEVRSLSQRKEYSELLISEDRDTFKKFIEVLQYYFDNGINEETPQELLQIDIDKFLKEDIVEYLDNDLSFSLDGNKEVKKIKNKDYSSLSAKSSK